MSVVRAPWSCVIPIVDFLARHHGVTPGSPIVPALICGVPTRLLLDTGTSLTTVHPAFVERLTEGILADEGAVPVTTLGAEVVTVRIVRVRTLQLGAFALQPCRIGVAPHHVGAGRCDGVLGCDVLGHVRMTLDLGANEMILEGRR